jgi:hypothetical protein
LNGKTSDSAKLRATSDMTDAIVLKLLKRPRPVKKETVRQDLNLIPIEWKKKREP